jgi:hypothetical protein
MQGSKS